MKVENRHEEESKNESMDGGRLVGVNKKNPLFIGRVLVWEGG